MCLAHAEPLLAPDPDGDLDGVTLAWLALLVLVLVGGPALLARDVWSGDETRYAEVARQMGRGASVWVPHLNGAVYAEKPPLYFWLTAFVSSLGVGVAVAGRLVSWLSTAAAAGAVYLLGRELLPKRVAPALAALIYVTLPPVLERSQEALLDPLLTACSLLAAVCLVRAARGPGWKPLVLGVAGAWLCLSAGCLTKGPVALLSPGLAALTLLPRTELPRRRAALVGLGLAAVGALAVTGGWLWLASREAGAVYAHKLAVVQTAGRVGGSTVAHAEPLTYYLLQVPLRLLPWSALAPGVGLALLATRWEGEARPVRRLLLWAACGFLVLSAVGSKRFGYCLPLLAPLVLALAYGLADTPPSPRTRWWLERPLAWTSAASVSLAVLVLAGAGLGLLLERSGLFEHVALPGVGWWIWTGLCGLGALRLAWAWRDRKDRVGGCLHVALATALVTSVVFGVGAAYRNPRESMRPFVEQVAAALPPGARPLLLQHAQDGRFNLFLPADRLEVASLNELEAKLATDEPVWVVTRARVLSLLAPAARAALKPVLEADVGARRRRWVLLCAHRPTHHDAS